MTCHAARRYRLVVEFTQVCERIAQAVVEDMALPPAARRVPPVSTSRGVAGGEKYQSGANLSPSRWLFGVLGGLVNMSGCSQRVLQVCERHVRRVRW